MRRTSMVAAVVAAVTVVGAGSAGAEYPAVDVDTAKVAEGLHAVLGNGNTVGYAFAVSEGGQLVRTGAGGKARVDKNIAFTPYTRMEIFSATKNVVAAATLKLAEAAGLTPDTRIWEYLPPDMRSTAHPSWQNVTIRHMLGHLSGVGQLWDNNPDERPKMTPDWDGIKHTISKPIAPSMDYDPDFYNYENLNYAVARVVIPRLWRLTEPERGLPDWIGPTSPPWTINYVNEKLFAPAGISWVTCLAANAETATHGYNLYHPEYGGNLFELSGSAFQRCPSYRGLHMSAVDMVRWQAYLRHGTIVSPTVRQWMDSLWLGWRDYGQPAGMYAHGGGYSGDWGRSVNTCHGKFPGDVEVSLVVNSQIRSGTHPCVVLINAVKAAS
ncbi:serine hydrolase domain-containing protein [Actinokineospora sp. HUAS TT18]|uniref:serine hydrolase domain-containing protein n=1 Tax=Actinokineospora sp. HUAS TT18 TaxID=3447451 RepID=UPI003F524958